MNESEFHIFGPQSVGLTHAFGLSFLCFVPPEYGEDTPKQYNGVHSFFSNLAKYSLRLLEVKWKKADPRSYLRNFKSSCEKKS